jgi:hypothetical protein
MHSENSGALDALPRLLKTRVHWNVQYTCSASFLCNWNGIWVWWSLGMVALIVSYKTTIWKMQNLFVQYTVIFERLE